MKLSKVLNGNTEEFESFNATHTKLNSGYNMPLLGWGSFQASANQAERAVQQALQAGFRVCNSPCQRVTDS